MTMNSIYFYLLLFFISRNSSSEIENDTRVPKQEILESRKVSTLKDLHFGFTKFIPYEKLYEKVLKVLIDNPVTSEIFENLDLKFEEKDFLNKIGKLIESKIKVSGENFKFPPSFSHDLLRFVFKQIIFMIQESIISDRCIERNLEKDYEYLAKYLPHQFSNVSRFKSLYMNVGFWGYWASLIYLEAIERGEAEIIHSLDSIINSFYGGDGDFKSNCKETINHCFRGRVNNDFILRAIVLQFNGHVFKENFDLHCCMLYGNIIQNHEFSKHKFLVNRPIKLERLLMNKDMAYLEQRKSDLAN